SQIVRFAPLAPDDLRAILAANGIEDPAQIERLIRLSGGSAGRALALNDDEFWKLRNTMIDGLTSPKPNFAHLVATWENYYKAAGKETRDHRLRVALVLRFLVETLQLALRLSQGADVPGLDG